MSTEARTGVSATRPLAARNWPGHLLALVAVIATVLLGRWQYGVWQGHRADSSAAVTRESPVPLDRALGPDAAFPDSGLGRPVVVTGRWDPAGTVFVSGRPHGDATGYWAVTPVTTSSGSEIPVVRGWLSDPDAAPTAPGGPASLVGLLQPSDESAGAVDAEPGDDVLPSLSITALLSRTDRDLYGGYVLATDRALPGSGTPSAASSTGMIGLAPVSPSRLPDAGTGTALRNLLYAFQWWVFSLFVVVVWWRWLQEDVLGRPRRRRPGDPEQSPTDG